MSHRILIAGLVTGALLAPRPAGGLTVNGGPSAEYGALSANPIDPHNETRPGVASEPRVFECRVIG